ncbi:MAG: hypothetical protein R2764_19460 [Bacteroidales bacterium]
MISCFCILIICNAQPHQAFKYQAIVRNASGEIISNQPVGVQISIRNNDIAGPIIYQETHAANTNDFGLMTLNIGMGTQVGSYDFETIPWEQNAKFVEVEVDPLGGTNYISMGVSELLSVPYSLFSGSSADGYWDKSNDKIYYTQGNVGIGTTDPLNKLEVNGTTLVGNVTKAIRFRTNGAIADIESIGTDLAINYQGYGNTIFNVVSGNVGIGTLSPAYPLHLINSSGINWIAGFHNTSTSLSSNGLVIRADGGSPLLVQNDVSNLFIVRQNGYVGIGTSDPISPLEIISHGVGSSLRITNTTGTALFRVTEASDGSAGLYLYDDNFETKVYLSAGGNSYIKSYSLGLGTASPINAKLQIEGTEAYDAMIKLNNTGTNGAQFFIGSTNSAWGGGANQNLFVMGYGVPSSANIDLVFNSGGQVGIATTTPTQTLDVNGGGRYRS